MRVGLAASIALCQNLPTDYPQWRGKTRDGSASAFSKPKSWPEKLTLKWKVEVGDGYATPIVVGNVIYVFTRRESDEVMSALDAATGKVKWQTRYPAPYQVSPPAREHGGGPKATPLFHRGNVYTVGISGIVTAINTTNGKLLWQTAAATEQPYFGMAASPLGYDDLILAHPGNYGPLTAFEASTGKVRWAASEGGAYASPILVEIGGTKQIVATTQKSLLGISVEDGSLLWRHAWAPEMPIITPVQYGEVLLVSGRNAGVAAIRLRKKIGKWTSEIVWETKEVSMYMSNPVLIRDTLFGLSHTASGRFFALDAKTGKILWLGEPREAMNTAIVKAEDLLFILNDDAELIVARSSDVKFEPLKRYIVAEAATWAQPAISGKRVFVKDVSSLALWTWD
ncbi:MAG TPA: PQQ-binding-like beta-propeller repeat protein [Bryobacteraceae bacterium]|nr:PQQ-binding-like beta-propeller repeat protein [Bryobacteraceae bacterium]